MKVYALALAVSLAVLFTAGEGDGNNNFKARCDVFNIAYSNLYSVYELRGI